MLNQWIAQAEGELGEEARSGRLGRLIASSVAIAAVQHALELGLVARHWPPVVVAHPHWADDDRRAAASAAFDHSLDESIAEVNTWISAIDAAHP